MLLEKNSEIDYHRHQGVTQSAMNNNTLTDFHTVRLYPSETEQVKAIAKQFGVPKHQLLRRAVKMLILNPEAVKLLLKLEANEALKSQVQQGNNSCCTVR